MTNLRFIIAAASCLYLFAGIPGRCESTATRGTFKASCVKVNITPDHPVYLSGYGIEGMREKPSSVVHDSLYVRTCCLESGESRVFIISAELGGVSDSWFDEFAERLLEEHGIAREQVYFGCTHTHSGPSTSPERNPRYSEWLMHRALESAALAADRLEPARLGFMSGIAVANVNRRARFTDSPEVADHLGINPDKPVDRQLGIIRIDRQDGSLLAVIANYAMHGTAIYATSEEISGDAPGSAISYAEDKLGVPVLYINGAAGNIDPIYGYKDRLEDFHNFDISEFGPLLGEPIVTVQKMVSTTDSVCIESGVKELVIPARADRETSEEPVKKLRIGFLRINSLAVFSAPLELFCEIAMTIRKASPFEETYYFGYTNGSAGYLPVAQAFVRKGYETRVRVTPFDQRAERIFTDFVTAELDRIHNEH